MRSPPLTAVLLAVLALALGACGGDDEPAAERRPKPPELTVPEREPASETSDRAPTTSAPPAPTTSAPPAPTTTGNAGDGDSGGAAAGGGGSSGGTPAPTSPPQDDQTNDAPPPAGSPAERFERFCEANPGACD